VASGMRSTFQNSGTALSIGAFFSLMIIGLASSLPKTLTSGLQRQGVAHSIAHHVGTLPPVSSLFAAVLGVNPLQHLLAPSGALSKLPAAAQQTITGREFFPHLIRAGSELKASDDQIGAVELTASPGVEPPMHVHRHEDEWYSEHP
jgi:hypothetical protein